MSTDYKVDQERVDADILKLEKLLTHREDYNHEELRHQFDTALRLRHDLWTLHLTEILEQSGYNRVEPEFLSPDICFVDLEGVINVIEVSSTHSEVLLSEKRKKYSSYYPRVMISSPTVHEAEMFLSFTPLDYILKRKYFDKTNWSLDTYKRKIERDTPDSQIAQRAYALYDNFTEKEQIRWPKDKTYQNKDQAKYFAKFKNNNTNLACKSMEDLLTEVTDVCKAALQDEEIRNKYSLQESEKGEFSKAHKEASQVIKTTYNMKGSYKPTFLVYAPAIPQKPGKEYTKNGKLSEQLIIKAQLAELRQLNIPIKGLANSAWKILEDEDNMNVFTHGLPLHSGEKEADYRLAYKNHKKQVGKHLKDNMPTRSSKIVDEPTVQDYIRSCGVSSKEAEALEAGLFSWVLFKETGTLLKEPLRAVSRKTLLLEKSEYYKGQELFFDKSKTGMTHDSYAKEKLSRMEKVQLGDNRKVSCDPHLYKNEIEGFVKYLSEDTEVGLPQEITWMNYMPGSDAEFFSSQKAQFTEYFLDFQEDILSSRAATFAHSMKRSMEQLIHLQSQNLRKGHFSFFNNGDPSYLYIVEHGLQDRGRDSGKAFMIVKFGTINNLEAKLFGFQTEIATSIRQIYMTGWRRLSNTRLTFHADQVYSVLSTAFSTYMRSRMAVASAEKSRSDHIVQLKSVLAFRYIIGLAHSQNTAEMLSDFRYLYMNAFSEFCSTNEFVVDKFTKPIRTCLDAYLFSKIPQFDELRKEYRKGGVLMKGAKFLSGARDVTTTGGTLCLTSILHPNYKILDIQDLLDDMFLYVHTNKEPANQYHEFVKAMNTILDFEARHQEHNDDRKMGHFDGVEGVLEFLKTDNKVGYWDTATYSAGKILSDDLKNGKIDKKISKVLASDHILNMNSTKSIIPERKRKITQITQNNCDLEGFEGFQKYMRKKRKLLWQSVSASTEAYFVITETLDSSGKDTLKVVRGTNRCKVHDSTLDLLEHGNFTTSLSLATWNIEKNKSRVVTDICIKAQYGAKREFYVINHGAKAMARCLEQGYRVVCEHLSQEMISVSGDAKMFKIQEILDSTLRQGAGKSSQLYYCNGDCTKWSAAETMECLGTFNKAMEDTIGTEFANYTQDVLEAWTNKEVFIPPELLKNVYYEGKGSTYNSTTGTFKSTQNFLQGMFNYMSSSKAVACSELTYAVWKRLFPDKQVILHHMEHSDDYAFTVICNTAETFSEFKLLHRIIMRFCGINDSTKKTNCQTFLLEFISLISFNGVMTYPHIKKVKETGLNIGATGYASDIKTTCSRVGEACRVGVSFCTAYVMSRIQNVRIAEAYGMFGYNKDVWDVDEMADVPIELWGFPDSHPIMYLLTTGDPDNLRIRKFAEPEKASLLDALYFLQTKSNVVKDQEILDDTTLSEVKLYHPHYTYMIQSKLLKEIRASLGYSIEDSQKYWENHYFDLYLKPTSNDRVIPWMKSKYFQSTFAEAYMRQGRAQLQMRISHFVRQKCLTLNLDDDTMKLFPSDTNMFTIKEYVQRIKSIDWSTIVKSQGSEEQKIIEYAFDPTVVQIYVLVKGMRVINSEKAVLNTKAHKQPSKDYDYTCSTDPVRVLQFLFSEQDFIDDGFVPSSMVKFIDDIEKVKRLVEAITGIADPTGINFSDLQQKGYIVETLQAMKLKTKPLLLKFEPKNDLYTTIHGLLERHSHDRIRYTITAPSSEEFIAKNIKVDPTSQLYMPRTNSNKNWVEETPGFVQDLCLLLFALRERSLTNIRDIFSKLVLKTTKMNAIQYITKLKTRYIDGKLKADNKTTQALFAVCDVVLQDSRPLNEYMKSKLGYTYTYKKETPMPGYTTVFVVLLETNYKMVFKEADDESPISTRLTIFTDSTRLSELGWAYNIGLRLSGQISVGTLLKRLDLSSFQFIPNENPMILGSEEGTVLYRSRSTGKFTLLPDQGDFELPIVILNSLIIEPPSMQDTLHQQAYFDRARFSAFAGKAKVFTPNVLTLPQMDAWKFTGRDEEPINLLLSEGNMNKLYNGRAPTVTEGILSKMHLKPNTVAHTDDEILSSKKEYKLKHRTDDAEAILKNYTNLMDGFKQWIRKLEDGALVTSGGQGVVGLTSTQIYKDAKALRGESFDPSMIDHQSADSYFKTINEDFVDTEMPDLKLEIKNYPMLKAVRDYCNSAQIGFVNQDMPFLAYKSFRFLDSQLLTDNIHEFYKTFREEGIPSILMAEILEFNQFNPTSIEIGGEQLESVTVDSLNDFITITYKKKGDGTNTWFKSDEVAQLPWLECTGLNSHGCTTIRASAVPEEIQVGVPVIEVIMELDQITCLECNSKVEVIDQIQPASLTSSTPFSLKFGLQEMKLGQLWLPEEDVEEFTWLGKVSQNDHGCWSVEINSEPEELSMGVAPEELFEEIYGYGCETCMAIDESDTSAQGVKLSRPTEFSTEQFMNLGIQYLHEDYVQSASWITTSGSCEHGFPKIQSVSPPPELEMGVPLIEIYQELIQDVCEDCTPNLSKLKDILEEDELDVLEASAWIRMDQEDDHLFSVSGGQHAAPESFKQGLPVKAETRESATVIKKKPIKDLKIYTNLGHVEGTIPVTSFLQLLSLGTVDKTRLMVSQETISSLSEYEMPNTIPEINISEISEYRAMDVCNDFPDTVFHGIMANPDDMIAELEAETNEVIEDIEYGEHLEPFGVAEEVTPRGLAFLQNVVLVEPKKNKDMISTPYTVNIASNNWSMRDALIGRSLFLANTIKGTLTLHQHISVIEVLCETLFSLETQSHEFRYLSALHLSLNKALRANLKKSVAGQFAVKMQKDKVVFMKKVRLNRRNFQDFCKKVAPITGVELEYVDKGSYVGYVPINECDLGSALKEMHDSTLNMMPEECMYTRELKIMLETKSSFDEFDNIQ